MLTGLCRALTPQPGAAGESRQGVAARPDTVFRIFSMTKAVGSTAATMLMDRGRLDADGKPRMRAPRTKTTVRHLAPHTSGLVYEFWNPDLPRYMAATGLPTVLSGLREGLDYPLLFDPDIAPRLASVRMRGEDGQFADFELAPPAKPAFYGMGHALYSTAPDYLRFLRMFLHRGQLDGQRILSEAGLARMLQNQIGEIPIPLLKTAAPPVTADAEFFPGRRKTHSMAFQRIEEDVPGMRSAGSHFWAGVCNTHYWIDPAKDVAGLLMTQTLPFVEPRFMGVYEAFEQAVYRNTS